MLSSIHRYYPLMFSRQIETVELVTVEGITECLTKGDQLIVDCSLPIPPNTQFHLPVSQSWLDYGLVRFVGFRPRPLSYLMSVIIVSHNPLQK
uniref:Uncharacterized protein n=1 Tax=Lepeophtheirus salmonis TaxID=72036 RepID=A0A0K2SXV5_LEPSM